MNPKEALARIQVVGTIALTGIALVGLFSADLLGVEIGPETKQAISAVLAAFGAKLIRDAILPSRLIRAEDSHAGTEIEKR